MRRFALVLAAFAAFAAFVALASLGGCRTTARPIGIPLNERTQFESEWDRYGRLEPQRALAVAGNRGGRHVTGFAFGKASREEAVQSALDACAQRRSDRRIEDGCRLYAIEDEIQPEE